MKNIVKNLNRGFIPLVTLVITCVIVAAGALIYTPQNNAFAGDVPEGGFCAWSIPFAGIPSITCTADADCPQNIWSVGSGVANTCETALYHCSGVYTDWAWGNGIKLCDPTIPLVTDPWGAPVHLQCLLFGGWNAGTCDTPTSDLCGDWRLTPPEECDDGNLDDGDGCSGTCKLECGNGVITPNEECDDGNTDPGDGCSAACQLDVDCSLANIDHAEGSDTWTLTPHDWSQLEGEEYYWYADSDFDAIQDWVDGVGDLPDKILHDVVVEESPDVWVPNVKFLREPIVVVSEISIL
jgi:cysteine-rich repeat protein